MSGVDALARMLPSLAVIVGALLLLRHWAQKGRGGTSLPMRVVSRTGIGKGSVVAVVEVGQRRLLVGAADQGISLLAELDEVPQAVEAGKLPTASTSSSPKSAAAVPATNREQLLGQLHRGTPAEPPMSTDDRPRMALIDRLRHMTVRSSVTSHPQRPNRAHPHP